MNILINELKQEHKEISNILTLLIKTGASSKNGFSLLQNSKTLLLKHLANEDGNIYPILYKEAEKNKKLRESLNIFTLDMDTISNFILAFYNKYDDVNKIDENQFSLDIASFVAILKTRILKEELVIYKAYEDLKID